MFAGLVPPDIGSLIDHPSGISFSARLQRGLAASLFPGLILAVLGLTSTLFFAWALAAWLPHDHLLRRRNVISQPAPGTPAHIKPVPHYITVYQFSRRA